MAGRPRRTAMVTKLQQLTRDYFEDETHTPLDFAVAWTERGRTLTALAAYVTEQIHGLASGAPLKPGQFDISRHMITSYLDEVGGEGTSVRLTSARRSGAHGMVEEGVQTLDTSRDDRDTINANERRLTARERLAAVWNKEFAKAGNNTNVLVSFGQMHLDALRTRQQPAVATISPTAEGAEPVDVTPERE
jgi:hypothetical protein